MRASQVDARVSVELLLPFRFGHVAWAGADCRDESCARVSAQVEHDVRACSFGLSTSWGSRDRPWDGLLAVYLGARVCSDQVGQASGERGTALIDAAPTLAY